LARAIERAENASTFYAFRDDIARRVSTADAAVPDLVTRSTFTPLSADARQVVVDAGKQVLHDAACGLAWDLMKPQEQTAVNDSGHPLDGDLIPQLVNLSAAALTEAISGFLKSRYLRNFYDADIVDWALYAEDIHGKAADLTSDGESVLVLDDVRFTRAMAYFAQFCLKPPA
jgi:hypothetical protein